MEPQWCQLDFVLTLGVSSGLRGQVLARRNFAGVVHWKPLETKQNQRVLAAVICGEFE